MKELSTARLQKCLYKVSTTLDRLPCADAEGCALLSLASVQDPMTSYMSPIMSVTQARCMTWSPIWLMAFVTQQYACATLQGVSAGTGYGASSAKSSDLLQCACMVGTFGVCVHARGNDGLDRILWWGGDNTGGLTCHQMSVVNPDSRLCDCEWHKVCWTIRRACIICY